MWILFQVQPTILSRSMFGLGLSSQLSRRSLFDSFLCASAAGGFLLRLNPVCLLWVFSHLLKRPFHGWPWSLLQDAGLISFHRLWPRRNPDNSCCSRSSSIALCWGRSHDPPGLTQFTCTWLNWWRSTQLLTSPYDHCHKGVLRSWKTLHRL